MSENEITAAINAKVAESDFTTDSHEHAWSRRQNVTTKGYVMPPYEVCGCGAARHADAPTPTEPDADERHHLAELIWNVSRRDEGTISATGANIVADAILAAGYSRTPDAHLTAAKAETLREAGVKVAAMRNGATGRRVTNAEHLGQVVYAMGDDIEYQAARTARLREQGESDD